MLTSYESITRFLLHDSQGQAYATADIDTAINRVRRELAAKSECVRALLSGGTITALGISNGGSGYAGTITVNFSGAGSQTTAIATQSLGVINSVTLITGGWGWVAGPPTITVTGSGGGSGAVITATVNNAASTVAGQEVYSFAALNGLAVLTPGISQVIGINSIAAQWGAGSVYKPTLQRRGFSWFQANARVYSIAAMNFPAYWAKYGSGSSSVFYLFPIPAQVMSMDIDAICLPIPLADDTTPEAIPELWQQAVPFGAAYYCYMNSSREADAKRMYDEYEKYIRMARKGSEASAFVPDQYATI